MAAVGDGDYVGGFVDAALEGALVAGGIGIGVGRVERGVAGLSFGGEGAVGAVDGVEEVVEEAVEGVVGLVDVVVGLEEDGVLGVDYWVGDLEV